MSDVTRYDYGPVRVVRNALAKASFASVPGPEHVPTVVSLPFEATDGALILAACAAADLAWGTRMPRRLRRELDRVLEFRPMELAERTVAPARDLSYTRSNRVVEAV